MILVEDITSLLPCRAGKVVGIASYRGEYMVVACEHGLYRLWDDGVEIRATETTAPGEGSGHAD